MRSTLFGRGPEWSQMTAGDAILAAIALGAIAAVLWFVIRPWLAKQRNL
jgi:hypothetical protein